MHVYLGIIFLSLGLSGCFNMPVLSKGKVSTLDESPRLASTVSASESKSIAAYDPNSKVATTIPAPSGALAGSTVTLPAGALAIAAELVVEEAVPLSQTSVTSSLAISSDITITPVGSGLIIRPTENVDLTKPLTIAMPIDPTAGLRAWLAKNLALNTKYYTVFYKYFVNGELKAGAIPSNELRFSDTGSVLFEGYFGAYWLAEVSAPIQEKVEVTTAEPIVNKDNVAVVTNTGIVAETEVVAKATIPTVEWLTVNLAFDTAQRIVTADASIAAGRVLNSCQVDLFEKTDAQSGLNIDAGSSLSISYKVIRQDAHTLYARFRCMDDQARQTMSPWSTALSIPALPAAPVATASTNFCANPAPELRLLTTSNTAAGGFTTQTFTSLGNCIYTADIDALMGAGIGIITGDGKMRCTANGSPLLGDQTITCSGTGDSTPNMWLAQGNYTIKLDFTGNTMSPKMTLSLQDCSIGEMYALPSADTSNFPTPAASYKLTHIGGCQYTGQVNKISDGYLYVRLQNQNGTVFCGNNSSLSTNTQQTISCSPSPGYFMHYTYGAFLAGFKYVLNLGNNLDMNGQPTSSSYIWNSEVDKCTENRYLIGPTPAGNNRQPGVNDFRKYGSCTFDFAFIQGAASFTPFFIGVGEGTEKCGVAPATAPGISPTLDCSPNAVAIDMQAFVATDIAYRISLQTDSTTGKPSSIYLQAVNNVCSEPYFATVNATAGFRPSLLAALTEVSECIYQYDWIPTAASRNLSIVSGQNHSYRCARFPGFSNPVVNGPAVDLACYSGYSSALSVDYPFNPSDVVNGSRYKVNLDFRLGNDRPKISIASHGFTSCPELYVLGLGGLNTPDPSNKMTQTGVCNYSYGFKTGVTAPQSNFRISDGSGTILCGRDSANGYLDPATSGQTVSLACSAAAPYDFSLTLGTESNYQLNVHYDNGGASSISLHYLSNNCAYTQFDGPAAADHDAAFTRWTTPVDQCVDEVLWVPTTTNSAFLMKSDYYSYAGYCGLKPGSVQPSLSNVSAEALCGIFNVTQATNFSVAEGINAGSRYLVRLDRSQSPYDAPKLSVSPVSSSYDLTQSKWIGGSSGFDAWNGSFPGSRWGAAVWSPAGSQYRYMFGGLGRDDSGTFTELADLWRHDIVNNTWQRLPDGNFGALIGNVTTVGNSHALNRPSARVTATAIYDPSGSGKLWLYGGSGYSYSGATGYLNDLWVYDLGTNEWAVVSGDPVNPNGLGNLGTFGVPSHSNVPGARNGAVGWIDGSGRIYIFGGYGFPDTNSPHSPSIGHLNDLWVFDRGASYETNSWAQIGGTNLLNVPGTANQPSTRMRATAWQDNAGKIWLFGGHGTDSSGSNGRLSDMWTYNISSNAWTRFGGPNTINANWVAGSRYLSSSKIWPSARFGAAGWKTPDGKLWFVGGDANTALKGNSGYINDIWNFDPATGQWTWLGGSTQSISGYSIPYANQPGTFGAFDTFSIYNQIGARGMAMAWPDNAGNVFIFAGISNYGLLNDLWYLDF